MSSANSRGNLFESAVSIFIVIILAVIGALILVRQAGFDMGRFGITAPEAVKDKEAAAKTYPLELSSVMPNGFETTSETEIYNSDNLFEKINGKSPLYTESGFERLFTQRFADENGRGLMAELYIYDMGLARNAFCVYSQQKREGTENLPDFAFAYRTENAVYFAHGRYYIELVGFSESAELFEAMVETCRKIRATLAVDQTTIAELELFPQENMVDGSTKLYLSGAFGFEKLTDTFTARYEIDGETVTAFMSRRTSQNDAEKSAESYYKFLIDNGSVDKEQIEKTAKYKVVDFYDTFEIISTTGPFVFGVHEAEDQKAAEKLALKLAEALSNPKIQ